jgi:hypothetical protein
VTTKKQVDLDTYKKSPRLLMPEMERMLGTGGGLHPILDAVTRDDRLRLDIREHRFNVYYGGGSLLLVDGRKSPWLLSFDRKYFRGGKLTPPSLPAQFSKADDSRTWVAAFPALIAGMNDWWTRHPKIERTHCQAMAAANSATGTLPSTDYLVLDLEYQWAQRRFDMVAAKRSPTADDPTGWVAPNLVFVEVKSDYRACSGKSGLGDHADDYRDIITAGGGRGAQGIKLEYHSVLDQKRRLQLLDRALPFDRFSDAVPELLFVFVDLDPKAALLREPLKRVMAFAHNLRDAGRIRFMQLSSPDYTLSDHKALPPDQFIGTR